MSRCRYVEGYGYFLRAHELNCREDCDGCQPCTHDDAGNPVRHCTARTRCTSHLGSSEALTCARCIGRTRQDIAEIVSMSDELIDEAVEDGVDSEAADLAGPAADPEAAMWRRLAGAERLSEVSIEPDRHPLTVLGTWDFMWREDYDQPTTRRCTITAAATYLDGMLGRVAQDENQDWPLFASEIASCRTHLAEVLHLAKRPEKGAPCPACAAEPALVKHYDERDTTGKSDTWRCPACRQSWSEQDYRLWVTADYLEHAKALTASNMQMMHGIKPGSLTGWATAGKVRKVGKDQHGRQLYSVDDARRMAGATPERESA